MEMPKYIAFEGADGTGKTTLSKAFARAIGAEWTYEPHGGTEITKQLRSFCLDRKHYSEMNWKAREYLLLATRALSTYDVQTKVMKENKTVITDRSMVSGMVYAHVASQMSFESWWELGERAFWIIPELVILIKTKKQNIDVNKEDIYDNESDNFHSRIRRNFIPAMLYLAEKVNFLMMSFENDFTVSVEQNLERLLERIKKGKPSS